MTRDEMVAGFQRGGTLVIQRRDAPDLPIALELVSDGIATQEFIQYDDQSSALLFRAAERREGESDAS